MVLQTSSWKKIQYKFADGAVIDAQHGPVVRADRPCANIMRTQTPIPPSDVGAVEMARYGEPQHETSTTSVESLYGPPQHETEIQDPEWLISIARSAFSVGAPEPAGTAVLDEPPAESPERERTVVRL